MYYRPPLPKYFARLTLALSTAIMASLVWVQFHGFDLSDGGYYFLLFHDPSDNFDTHTRFHYIARPIWLLSGENVVVFRLFTIGIVSGACLCFWRSFRSIFAHPSDLTFTWWPFWVAAIAGVSWVPLALTYNSLACVFTMLGLSSLVGFLKEYRTKPARVKWLWIYGLTTACLMSAIYFSKPPASLAFAAATFVICFLTVLPKSPIRGAMLRMAIFLPAAAAAAALINSQRDAQGRLLLSLGGVLVNTDWLKITLERYSAEIGRILPALWRDYRWLIVPTSVACFVSLTNRINSSFWSYTLRISLGFVLAGLLSSLVIRGLWDGSFANAVTGEAARFYLILWGSLLPIWCASLYLKSRRDAFEISRHIGWVLILLLLPLVGSLGSTNAVYVSALHETVFWAAGLLLIAEQISSTFDVPWFSVGVAALIFLGAAGQIFSGQFWKPYMFQKSVWEQTSEIEVGNPATKLKLDPALADFLRSARSILDANGYKPGDDVFGFFNLPGVIFALGAKEPGAPWYFGTWYHDDDTDGGKLRRVALVRRQRAWIITQADVTMFRPQFLKCGIDFPDGYIKIGQTMNPTTGLEIGIWKPHARD